MLYLFEVPKGPLNRFDFYRKCLWLEEDGAKKYHLVSWDKIFRPKEQGFLGVMHLEVMNNCLISKWLWKLDTSNGMLKELLRGRSKYARQ